MIKYLLGIFLVAASFKCIEGMKNITSKPSIEAIEVRDISPMMGETYYRVFHLNNLIMYQSQYRFDSLVDKYFFDSATNRMITKKELKLREWRNRFFVFHKDSSYGYGYDSIEAYRDNKRLKVDSMVKLITGTNSFEMSLRMKPDSIIWNADKTELKEVYLFPEKNDTPAIQMNFYYSLKLNHLKESFNPILDSAKKMKLFKTETIVHKFYSEKDKMLWPETMDATEMREITVENPNEIMSYFDRYKKSIGQN